MSVIWLARWGQRLWNVYYSVLTLNISLQDTVKKAWSHDGYYSVVGIKIDLVSRYRKYLFVYFIPTTMFTLTSWVSYLLPPTSYPARTSLLVTVFLCQVGIFTAAIKDTPSSDEGKLLVPEKTRLVVDRDKPWITYFTRTECTTSWFKARGVVGWWSIWFWWHLKNYFNLAKSLVVSKNHLWLF